MKMYGLKMEENYRYYWIGVEEIRKYGLASRFWGEKKKCGTYYSKHGSFKRLARLKIKKSERRYAKKQSMLLVYEFLIDITELRG